MPASRTFEPLESRRLLAAGDIDPTFGDGGAVPLDFVPRLVVPLADGQVILVDDNDDPDEINRLLRRNADDDMTLDTTFGTQGIVSLAPSIIEDINAAIILKDGKILLGGSRTDGNGAFGVLVRLTADGQLDTTFGDNGVASYPAALDAPLRLYLIQSLAEAPDGKIVFTGFIEGTGKVDRVNADGSPDPTFTPYRYDIQDENQVYVQSTGKVLLGGLFRKHPRAAGEEDDFFSLARLNTDGSLDTTFGQSGFIPGEFFNFRGSGVAQRSRFRVLPDDRILQAGTENRLAVLKRLTVDGQLDSTFGTNGVTTLDFGGEGIEYPTALGFDSADIVITPAGDIIVNNGRLARFSADGAWDESFGRLIMNNYGLVPQADGDLVMVNENLGPGTVGPQFVRLQGADGGPDGRITFSAGLVTIAASQAGETMSAMIGADEMDDVITVAVWSTTIGRVYDAAEVDRVTILGGGGNDLIIAKVGTRIRSSLSGGDGSDTIVGGRGEESISGNAGWDKLYGEGGNDRVAGNGGRDEVRGQDADDRLYGGDLGDWIVGGAGNDTLRGEAGDDFLYADGGGSDFMHGDAGDDIFNARDDAGDDTLFGDAGSDGAFLDDDDDRTSIESLLSQRPG